MKKAIALPEEPPSLEEQLRRVEEQLSKERAVVAERRQAVSDRQASLEMARVAQCQAEAGGDVDRVKAAETVVADRDRDARIATVALENAERELQAALAEHGTVNAELTQQRGRQEVVDIAKRVLDADREAEDLGLRALQLQEEGRRLRERLGELREFGGGAALDDVDTKKRDRRIRIINHPRYLSREYSEVTIG